MAMNSILNADDIKKALDAFAGKATLFEFNLQVSSSGLLHWADSFFNDIAIFG